MSTITLPNIRVSSDLTVSVRLKDNGVAIDWSTLNNVKASIYSDAQRALAGRCDVSVDAEDPTVLVCQYAANKPQYVGVCRIVVSAKYMGETKTHDKPAFNFVRWTADQDGEQITIDDPDVDVEIDVADVSSSLLDEAIRAAFTAAEEAVDAKGQVLETEAEVEAAEALRVSAEESRVEAEEGRAEAEAARVDEEAVRVSAEDARVVAENARAAAEDLREGAEDDRAAAETARETAEAARVAAEALRVTAEGSRETAEAAREAQASADHTVAAGDHTQAAADHTQAAADHTTAASDHTQAGADHTLAAADHVTAGEDHAQAQDDHEVMAGYDTRLGNVEGEVSQLEAKVGYLKGTETDVPNTTVVLTNADVVAGETIYYKVTVPQGNAGALRFYDLDNTILLTAGNTATTTEKTYSGAFVVPANFKNAAIVWGSGLTINYIYTSRTNEELQKAIIATNGKFTELNKRVGIVIDSPVSYPAATAVFGTETAKAGDVMKASLTTVTGHIAILGLLDSNGNRLSYVGFGSAQSPNTTKEVYFTIPEGFATAKAEWGELKINYLYTELQNDILRKDIDSLSDHYKKAIEVIRYDDLTTVIQNYPWSGFIPLYDVESIIFSLKPLGNQGAAPVYFYKNGEASYADPLADADIKYASYVKEGYYAKVEVPRGLHYMSFRSNHDTDFVILIHTSKDKSVDDRNLKEIADRSSVISDGFIPACGEPNLLYDPQRGIVYENYICGDSFGGDPGGNFGFAKFPLNQPERAIYKRAVTFGTTLVDGHPVTFRDTLWYWKTPYSVIRGITYGYSEADNVWGLHYFDMDTDGNISNFTLIKWSDDSIVNYDNNIAKLITAGITPYYSATPSAPESDHYKQLWPSSTHIQEYGGYKYFTLNMTRDCPMICRTNDDFATIEVVKAFQIKGDYEAVLVINGTDWYYLVRTQGQTYSLYYAYSEDAGTTWSAFTGVIGAANSKPRGFMYGGKVLFLVPLVGLADFPASGYTGTEDNIAASIRYVAAMIRGDKDTDINDWERPIVAVSKYGQNYGDIITVGKVLYYAWSCDETHLDNLPVSGKSQIRFTRIGNLDNTSIFGDF